MFDWSFSGWTTGIFISSGKTMNCNLLIKIVNIKFTKLTSKDLNIDGKSYLVIKRMQEI